MAQKGSTSDACDIINNSLGDGKRGGVCNGGKELEEKGDDNLSSLAMRQPFALQASADLRRMQHLGSRRQPKARPRLIIPGGKSDTFVEATVDIDASRERTSEKAVHVMSSASPIRTLDRFGTFASPVRRRGRFTIISSNNISSRERAKSCNAETSREIRKYVEFQQKSDVCENSQGDVSSSGNSSSGNSNSSNSSRIETVRTRMCRTMSADRKHRVGRRVGRFTVYPASPD
mmetsp:Transcript_16062/g.22545  ORF Transcript_16062/g.22545 Transcript_16062/m.22545 type:complete len:232 (-) Transcript_16062:202-897(-)|eukprot:CAMPEP_0185271932 /NCGR_PEP_ID=MMETSP1359-20130426/45951_1 /TAXON_ID=552665 /ORGANISM="Bigelowiella longifila, Strain CCMP242" /LENGTH=231 /DNA_ID=CAMNT_0027864041 /DNA_START=139 /DNA_END=834 /DNA_ORIENTATION=+